jgi:hypothetical protein
LSDRRIRFDAGDVLARLLGIHGKKMQKSAEGIVVPFDRSEGPNVK